MRAFTLALLFSVSFLEISAQRYEATFKNEPAVSALKTVIKTYNLKVSYSSSHLRSYKISKVVVANDPEQFLKDLLRGLPFSVKTNQNFILIAPTDQVVPTLGKVVDADTDAPLAFVLIQADTQTIVTDKNGSFRLKPSKDSIELVFSYLGYKKKTTVVSPNTESLVIALEQKPTVLQEVVLNGGAQQGLFTAPSSFSLNPRKFNSLPVLGETDVFKTLQLLPGVSATDESALGIQVRGGTHAQNLVTMDGFTIYNQDHFFGLFSSFNPNFINRVNIYKGGFGAEYGGRVASVVEVQTKSRTGDQLKATAGINFLSTNAFFEVPVSKKLTFLAGFRKSFSGILQSDFYQDFLSASRQDFIFLIEDLRSSLLPLTPSVDFYDLNAKLSYRPSSKTSLDLSFYRNEDNYEGSLSRLSENPQQEFRFFDRTNWSNLGLGIVLNHLVNPNWNLSASLGGSIYDNSETLERTDRLLEEVEFEGMTIPDNTLLSTNIFDADSKVEDVSLKIHNTFFVSRSNEIQAGLEFNSISTDFESFNSFFDFSNNDTGSNTESLAQKGGVVSFFASDAFILKNFSSTLGLRTSYYDGTGKWFWEPRFQSSYQAGEKLKFRLAYSEHYQYLTQVALAAQNIDQEYWVLADSFNVPVTKSRHLILGSDLRLGKLLFEIEGYRKVTDNIYQTGFFPFLVNGDSEFSATDFQGTNRTYGIDFFIKYRANRFNSWVSYTLAESRNSFSLLNRGRSFAANVDQRHEINWVNTVKLGRWELAHTLIYGSGRPFNNIALAEEQFRDFLLRNDEIEGERLPAYYRIDLSAKYSFSTKKLRWDIGTSIFNIFDFQNIRSRRRVLQLSDDEVVSTLNLDTQLLGRTPNFFISIHF